MKDTRSQRYDVGEPDPEYVSLEDLTTLAMNKIESLSVEGLRIQSGMFNKDALSNISPQSIGEISALKGILYFPPTPGPAQHVSSDGSPFSSPGLSSDRIGRIWIFFKLRDLEEIQNLLTEFYLAFLESLSSASLCSTQKLIEADGSSSVRLEVPNMTTNLHSNLDVFQKYSDLCAGNAGRQYTIVFKGATDFNVTHQHALLILLNLRVPLALGVGADYFANNDLENNFTISDVGADE
ncbi:plastid movement impaired 1-related 1 protein [Tanacetum coccineum]